MDSNAVEAGHAGEASDADRVALTIKQVELAVAAIIMAGGALVIVDSLRLGARWASDGPQAGYFPFYIGVLLVISSAVNLVRTLRDPFIRTFVTTGQGRQVLLILVPLTIYVGLIDWLGIYVASTLYIGVFMLWLGKYRILKTVLVSVGVSLAFFLMFEVWFKVPLIKGPLEAAFGLA